MLKIGVIGCGKITQVRHAPEYDENPNCTLIGWYDAIPGRAEEMAKLYPQYGFEIHKGYGTKAHYEALRNHGPSPIHRMTFLKKFYGTDKA